MNDIYINTVSNSLQNIKSNRNYVVVIEPARDNKTVAMVFKNLSIIKFVRQPSDYTIAEFIQSIEEKYLYSIIIVDKTGIGRAYADCIKGRIINAMDLNRLEALTKKDDFMEELKFATTFNYTKKLDFNIMKNQFDIFKSVKKENGNNEMLIKDRKDVDNGFAMCLLGYIAYIFNDFSK